jgi:hypothetical protein
VLVAVDAAPPVPVDLGLSGWVRTIQLWVYVRRLPGPIRFRCTGPTEIERRRRRRDPAFRGELGGMRIRSLAAAAAAAALAAAPAAASGTVPVPGPTVTYPGTVSVFHAPVAIRSYPVYDAAGRPIGSARWRTTGAGDNCCEDYVTTTSSGELVTFGGTYPMFSKNDGRTWYEVKPPTPLVNGEGAIVAGPGGNLYGIGWDFYSGDHLQAFRYDSGSRTWTVSEVPVKEPFYDRPWITVARGPFTINGQTFPDLVLVRGGGFVKDPELASRDGLQFTNLTSPAVDEQSTRPVTVHIPVVRNSLADYWQPHPWAGTIPLNGGGLLQITQPNDGDLASCPVSVLDRPTGKWHCTTLNLPGLANWQSSGEICCQLRQDSRGWLTDVVPNAAGTALLLYLSKDGGATWSQPLTLTPPRGKSLEADNLYDVAVNGRLGIAAVSARFDLPNGDGQDMVFRVDIANPRPRLVETYLVGKGDIQTGNNVSGSAGSRMDYASVAILPSGAVVASFDDSTTHMPPETAVTGVGNSGNAPNIAILLPGGAG